MKMVTKKLTHLTWTMQNHTVVQVQCLILLVSVLRQTMLVFSLNLQKVAYSTRIKMVTQNQLLSWRMIQNGTDGSDSAVLQFLLVSSTAALSAATTQQWVNQVFLTLTTLNTVLHLSWLLKHSAMLMLQRLQRMQLQLLDLQKMQTTSQLLVVPAKTFCLLTTHLQTLQAASFS